MTSKMPNYQRVSSVRSRGLYMRRIGKMALVGVLVFGAACRSDFLDVPNYNSPTVAGVARDPNGIQLLAIGLMNSERGQFAGYNTQVGVFGREVYNYFVTDARNISGPLIGIPGPQRLDYNGFASGQWAGRFQGMKNANALITSAAASALAADKKAGATGFAKTWYALDLFYIIQSRDTLGAPTDIPADPVTPAPFKTRDEVYTFISAMLDDAKTNLAAGGSAFPFTMHAGFAGYDTPANFLKFNRAIAAKVLVHRGSLGCAACYGQAITAIGESYATAPGAATTLAALNTSPLHVYSSTAGDVLNGASFAQTNFIYAHANADSIAQRQVDGVTKDDRVLRKLTLLASPVQAPGSGLGIPAKFRFNIYPNNNSSAPLLRNEELILLRAEASWATGAVGAALIDLNNVRTVSGKLAALASVPTGAAGLDLIQYEKHMSTLYEGNRWVDLRRWGRLGILPLDLPTHFRAKVMPIPQAECDARVVKPRGCEGNL